MMKVALIVVLSDARAGQIGACVHLGKDLTHQTTSLDGCLPRHDYGIGLERWDDTCSAVGALKLAYFY